MVYSLLTVFCFVGWLFQKVALGGSGVLWSIVTSEVPKCSFGGRSMFQVSDSAFDSASDSVFDSAFDSVSDSGTFAGH